MRGRGRIVLRLALPADAPALARIHRQARIAAMPWLPLLHTAEEDLAWMADVVLRRQHVCVATRDGVAVGLIALTRDMIEHLYVAPECWRSGAGSVLLDYAKERLTAGFRLWAFQRNAMARSFYRKHGLVELRMTDGAANEEREPDVLIGWKLTS